MRAVIFFDFRNFIHLPVFVNKTASFAVTHAVGAPAISAQPQNVARNQPQNTSNPTIRGKTSPFKFFQDLFKLKNLILKVFENFEYSFHI